MVGPELVEFYRLALLDAGYCRQDLIPIGLSGPRRRPRASTQEAFEAFANLTSAPTVLALIETFADRSGLRDRDDFSVSCLPGTGRTADYIRACTISVGWVEVLFVVLDLSTGAVAGTAVYGEADEDLTWLDGSTASAESGISADVTGLDGGGVCFWLPGSTALDWLLTPELEEIVSRRVAMIRARRHRSRRDDWHNNWLWALADSGVAPRPEILPPPPASEWDVSSGDALSLVRQRTSQRTFRRLLLGSDSPECAICGIDLVEVLEAAHLVPHARGGAASSGNGRLLCANHHRAYDAGLYQWTGIEFIWVGPFEEPALGNGNLG